VIGALLGLVDQLQDLRIVREIGLAAFYRDYCGKWQDSAGPLIELVNARLRNTPGQKQLDDFAAFCQEIEQRRLIPICCLD
jgi:hypothetical protein